MIRDITLGQYFPGNTVIHRLDPRVKLTLTIVYITALFLARGVAGYALMLCILLACIFVSKIKLKTIFRSIRPIIIIIAFTAILNIFFTGGEPVIEFWRITVTREGLIRAVQMVLRLVMLITGSFLLTYTTSPIALTDGIERMMNPLKKIKFPAHELAMMMSIALRFIPTLIEETWKIMSAQKARGANFETGGLIKRAKAIMPLIIPLFISAFRRADELATAMESRCYNGGEGRSRMKVLKMGTKDFLSFSYGAAVLAAVIVLGKFGL